MAGIEALANFARGGVGLFSGIAQAGAAKQTAAFNAAELTRAAGEERARASRQAMEERRKRDAVLSRQTAVGAASGAGTTEGEGYLDTVTDTERYGDFRVKAAIADGENRAAGRLNQAAMAKYEGDNQASRAIAGGVGSFMDGVGAAGRIMIKNNKTGTYLGEDEVLADGSYGNGWVTKTTRKGRRGGTYY